MAVARHFTHASLVKPNKAQVTTGMAYLRLSLILFLNLFIYICTTFFNNPSGLIGLLDVLDLFLILNLIYETHLKCNLSCLIELRIFWTSCPDFGFI